MMRHEVLELKEQKYVGIKTIIPFKDAEKFDFAKLHEELRAANINDVDRDEYFMAMDTDFTESSFSYTPLVPVRSFDNNKEYTQFTRKQGKYCAFEVRADGLSPAWFKEVFEYIGENGINVENTGYDLEYYDDKYRAMVESEVAPAERVLKVLFKMQS